MQAIPILACLLVLFCVPAAKAAAGPETAVSKVQEAIKTKNIDLLHQYLDVDAVTTQAAEWLLTDDKSLTSARKNTKARLVLAAVGKEGKAHDALRDLLVDETRDFVVYGVSSGSFAGQSTEKKYTGGLLSKVFAKALRGRKDFSAGKVQELHGETAVVMTTLTDTGSKKSFPLSLRVTKEDGRWRIKEVLNIEQLSHPKKLE